MRATRVSSVLTVSAAIFSAVLLIASSLDSGVFRTSAAQPTPARSQAKAPKAQPPTDLPGPLLEQRLVGGFWRLDHTFGPTLIITNALQNVALPVTPILYTADGREYDLPVITLSPAGVSSIDIRSAVAGAPEEIRARFSDSGSAALKYAWHSSGVVSALVENRDAKRSLNFDFELLTQTSSMAHRAHTSQPGVATGRAGPVVQQGLWWREDPAVKGFLGVTNTASRPVYVTVQVLSDYGAFENERNIHLQPNQTANLNVLDGVEGTSGGIEVRYDGTERDIALAGGLENANVGYSAHMPFVLATSAGAQSPRTCPSRVSGSCSGRQTQ